MKPIAIISPVYFENRKWPPFSISPVCGQVDEQPQQVTASNHVSVQIINLCRICFVRPLSWFIHDQYPHKHNRTLCSPFYLVFHLNCGAIHCRMHRTRSICALAVALPAPQHNGSRQEYKIMEICTSSCTRNRHAYLLFSYWTWFCPAKRSSKSQRKLWFRVRSCSRSSRSSRSSSKFIFHAIKSEIKANNSLKCELITFDICFKFKLCSDRLQQHHHPACGQDNEILIGKYALLHFTSGYYPWQILFISNSCGRCLAPNSSGNVDAIGITVTSAKTSFAIWRKPQIDINRYIHVLLVP